MRGRLRVATRPKQYVQRAVAWRLENQLSEATTNKLHDWSELCGVLVRAVISELFATLWAGVRLQTDFTKDPATHPTRRRLLLSRQAAELRQARQLILHVRIEVNTCSAGPSPNAVLWIFVS